MAMLLLHNIMEMVKSGTVWNSHHALFDMPSSTTFSEIFGHLNSQDVSSEILLLNRHFGGEDSK